MLCTHIGPQPHSVPYNLLPTLKAEFHLRQILRTLRYFRDQHQPSSIMCLQSRTVVVMQRASLAVLHEILYKHFIICRAAVRAAAVEVLAINPIADNVYDNFCAALVCWHLYFSLTDQL